MLLQYISWKRKWISQPHGNKWLNGRIQTSVSKTYLPLCRPSLCCCNTFPEKGIEFRNRTETNGWMVGFSHQFTRPTHSLYPPFLCCCKPFRKKDLLRSIPVCFLTVCRFFQPHTCHAQTCLRQCSFAMKNVKAAFQKAHTQLKEHLHCTGKLF